MTQPHRYQIRMALIGVGLVGGMVGCAGRMVPLDEAASTVPTQVYHVGREDVWSTAQKVILSIPTWDLVGVDEPRGLIMIEQRVRDRSFGGESRIAIVVTALDATHTKVEAQTIAEGGPRLQRLHSLWRFFGELDQLLEKK